MDYDEFYDMPEEQSRGILDILRTAGGNVLDFIKGGGFIGRGITGLANMLGDTFRGSRFYNPVSPMSGKRIFAPGARAGDAVGLGFRRDANRFANMINRLSQGKRIGRSNLTEIMGPARLGLTGIDVGGMADSIRDMEAKLDEQVKANVKLQSRLNETAKINVVNQVSDGLADTQKDKLAALAEGVEFTTEEEFSKKVKTIKESYFTEKTVTQSEVADETPVEGADDKDISPAMAQYLSALNTWSQ